MFIIVEATDSRLQLILDHLRPKSMTNTAREGSAIARDDRDVPRARGGASVSLSVSTVSQRALVQGTPLEKRNGQFATIIVKSFHALV